MFEEGCGEYEELLKKCQYLYVGSPRQSVTYRSDKWKNGCCFAGLSQDPTHPGKLSNNNPSADNNQSSQHSFRNPRSIETFLQSIRFVPEIDEPKYTEWNEERRWENEEDAISRINKEELSEDLWGFVFPKGRYDGLTFVQI